MTVIRTLYLRCKSILPESLREWLSAINQRFFARATLQRNYGSWFDVDWRKKFKSLTDSEWQAAYDLAWQHHSNDCVEETDEELILRALQEKGAVLEAGCGIGTLAMTLARHGHSVTGLDVSTVALKQAEERSVKESLAIQWRQGFVEKLPFPDRSFDSITCCHTLEHVRDLNQAASELKRVARDKILILTPKQRYRLYAENYHTQFFEREEQLIELFGLKHYQCREIDCFDHHHEFQGKAFFYIGYCDRP
ncbi:MAG: class I SAM-dependent methyltransferase [bacterium]